MEKYNIIFLENLVVEIYNKLIELNNFYYLEFLKEYIKNTIKNIPLNTNLFNVINELNKDLIAVKSNTFIETINYFIEKLENIIEEDGIVEYCSDKNLVIAKIRETIDLKKVDFQIKVYMN